MQCSNCGLELVAVDGSCSACGAVFPVQAAPSQQTGVADMYKAALTEWWHEAQNMIAQPNWLLALAAAAAAQVVIGIVVLPLIASMTNMLGVPADVGQSTSMLLAQGTGVAASALGIQLLMLFVPWIPFCALGIAAMTSALRTEGHVTYDWSETGSWFVKGAMYVGGALLWLLAALMLVWIANIAADAGMADAARAATIAMFVAIIAVFVALPPMMVAFSASPVWSTLLQPWRYVFSIRPLKTGAAAAGAGVTFFIGYNIVYLVLGLPLGTLGTAGSQLAEAASLALLLPYFVVLARMLKRSGWKAAELGIDAGTQESAVS